MAKHIALVLIFILTLSLPSAFAKSTTSLPLDARDTRVQGFAPTPSRCQVPATINAAATHTLNVTGWLAVSFRATGNVRVYFGTDTTKYMTFNGDERHVLLLQGGVTSVKFVNAGASAVTLEVWGM